MCCLTVLLCVFTVKVVKAIRIAGGCPVGLTLRISTIVVVIIVIAYVAGARALIIVRKCCVIPVDNGVYLDGQNLVHIANRRI